MRWKSGIVFAVILLAAAGAAETVFAQAQPLQTQPQPQAGALDFEKLYIDALGWLQGMIRIDTTNPPGNEMAAAKYLADILRKEGIPAETYESTPGRGILIARLSANSMPDPSRALLLLGHLDVVGVDKSKWQVDPFGAVIQNGYLYGRGAIDDKGMTIANVAVMVALKRSNVR
ncbi:MAG TPA: M20/M25/M40 family metallo-hydrolase, partial [Candidatus Acidoferrales bacterium]|nr:M20/M25/M40 family metallo-hydrolase [Candidatus Acidoferrales bacterium]